MKNTNYLDKLKNPKWQKKRLEVLNLRGFKCEICKCETKELHVHHRFYITGREVWDYDNDVFQVLCFDCHEKEHAQNTKSVISERYKELFYIIESSKEKFALEHILFIVKELVESKSVGSMSFAFNNSIIFDIILKQAKYCETTETYCMESAFEIEKLKNKLNGGVDKVT